MYIALDHAVLHLCYRYAKKLMNIVQLSELPLRYYGLAPVKFLRCGRIKALRYRPRCLLLCGHALILLSSYPSCAETVVLNLRVLANKWGVWSRDLA